MWRIGSRPGLRRLGVGALAVGVAVVAVGTWAWFAAIPGHRPALHDGEHFGIDVSNHQRDIDWAQAAADDIRFAYIKATEGGDFVDARFEENWHEAGAAGVRRGAYHFFTLCRPGADQAENFLHHVPPDPAALPPALDLELGGNCAGRPGRDDLLRELRAFIDRVERATGKAVVLYVLDDVEGLYHVRDTLARPLWVRSILHRPPHDDWSLWQVSPAARVAGIDGRVDLNVMSGREDRRST